MSYREAYMGSVLRTAVATAVWLLVQGLVGGLLLGRKGRPYKAYIAVIHIILFLPIAAGWAFTVYGLSTLSGNHLGSWIAQIAMGLAVVSLLVGGSILTAGKNPRAERPGACPSDRHGGGLARVSCRHRMYAVRRLI